MMTASAFVIVSPTPADVKLRPDKENNVNIATGVNAISRWTYPNTAALQLGWFW
jgi:hypothetical protein